MFGWAWWAKRLNFLALKSNAEELALWRFELEVLFCSEVNF